MTDLDHKRRQARTHADKLGQPMVLFRYKDDPDTVCEMPKSAADLLAMLIDIDSVIYPTRKAIAEHWDTCAAHMGMACSCGLEEK